MTSTLAIDLTAGDPGTGPVLSYPMAHNGVPIVDRIELHNSGPARQSVVVQIEVRDAEGVVTRPCERWVDLAERGTTALSDVGLVVDPAAVLQIEEQRPATLSVRVLADGELLGERTEPVRLLAARQWVSAPLNLSLEMLAAFVMPNDPAIAALLDEASTRLLEQTGSPSIQGFQDGPERVDEIVRAIYEAMQAREIRYSEPPASWADLGQKVRTPTDVLIGRVGTCLDTVVVLAAALEQAGVRPLLWVVEGHSFLGYWRTESALDAICQTDVASVVNYVDLGLIRLVETTDVTVKTVPVEFADTAASPYAAYLAGDLDRVLGVTDVWTARRNKILPLPSRLRTDDGVVQVIEYRPTQHSSPPQRERGEAISRTGDGPVIPPRVRQWKNALLDLSLRNRLLNFSGRGAIGLTVPEGQLAAIEDLVHGGHALHLLPTDAIDQVHLARGVTSGADLPQPQLQELLLTNKTLFTTSPGVGYATQLRNLAYKARTIVEETGANNLYLALGSLVWSSDNRQLRSPLILVPVKLVSASRGVAYKIELDESGTSTPNYCLLEKLRQEHCLDIPGLAEPVEDETGIDLDLALQAVRIAIAEKGLPYRVEPTADLSVLQFAKFRLWKDLDESWQQLLDNPLVRHLVESPTDPFIDPVPQREAAGDLDDLDASCPVPADASQLAAIAEAVAGRTFVLEGPPGTGKSQTITNLLTRAIADGKRVLFVAEKRAALDVVRRRLDAVGMGPFSLDLHDKGSKPAAVRAQIRAAMQHAVTVDDEGLVVAREDLAGSRRVLARYAQRLHELNGAGLSYYSAHTASLALGDGGVLPVPRSVLADAARLPGVRRLLTTLPDTADPARPSREHPWQFVTLANPQSLDIEAVRAVVAALDTAEGVLPAEGALAQLLDAARTTDDFALVAGLLAGPPVPLSVLDEVRGEAWQSAVAALEADVAAFASVVHPGFDLATPEALGLPLAEIQRHALVAAESGWFGRSKRLKTVGEELERGLRPGAEVPPKRLLELLTGLRQVQSAAAALAAHANAVPGVTVPTDWNPLTPDGGHLLSHQLDWLRWAGSAVDDATVTPFVRPLRSYLASRQAPDATAADAVQSLADAVTAVAQGCGTDAHTWDRWCGESGLLPRWRATSAGRALTDPQLLGLRRWVTFLEQLEPLRVDLTDARELLLVGAVHADDAVRALDRGLAAVSAAERRESTGLSSFDPAVHARTIGRFTTSAGAVREQLATALPRDVLSARPFQADTGLGLVGKLQRELAKQRRGLGVRGLLATYGELITQLMPCVLVSPDSVARFFAIGQHRFDLVVFDEASQIRVADAVGAMGRSQSVVIVGDSKQMPPTSFAEPALGTEEDFAVEQDPLVVEDEESILSESVQARVPQRMLSWHYRSQEESLIAFSNAHYYEGRLSSFPAPTHGLPDPGIDGYGINLVRVEGSFHRTGKGRLLRTNPVEADAVVAEIRRRFDASPDHTPSLGVVTFNAQQRAYIEALLRDSGDERLVQALDGTETEGLFVKNLENVQGDERDVILFSTAFSVNDKGVLPLNFGPLNRGGGERRLNVAITRARRQVLVFSSFDPAQLRAEETSSLGIRHLRAYLDVAAGGAAVGSGLRPIAVADRHRDEVAAALRRRGLSVQADVGLSEFRVDLCVAAADRPDQPVMAVLLDGPGWAARRTVGDRDGLPATVLTGILGWPVVERVWLPEWLDDREAVLDRLERGATFGVAKLHRSEPATVTASATVSDGQLPLESTNPLVERRTEVRPFEDRPLAGLLRSSAPVASQAPQVASSLPHEEPFVGWEPGQLGPRTVLDALPGPKAAFDVKRALVAAVEAEGPIHLDRLARLVAGAFDLTRVSLAREAAILDQLPREYRPDLAEPFAWPTGRRPADWTTFRRAKGESRPIEHISLRELRNAMVSLCEVSAGMGKEELLREALAVFGGKRLTPAITARLESAFEGALSGGRIAERDGRYVLASRV